MVIHHAQRLSVVTILAGLFALLAICGAMAASPVQAQNLAQDQEQEKTPTGNRIVSIGGSVTEIIFALGEQGRLVARDSTSNYPAAARSLPDIGYMRRLSPEGVLSVDPDLIIAEAGSGPPETITLLKGADIGIVTIPDDYSRDGIVAKVTAVAVAIGVPEKGAELAARIDTELKQAEAQANPGVRKKRVMFVLTAQDNRFLVSGTNTAADAIIQMAGGINALSEFEGYKPITDEAISAAMPDVILLMTATGPVQVTDEDLINHPAVSITPAAKTGSFVRLEGMLLLGFGPRTAQAVRELNRQLYRNAG